MCKISVTLKLNGHKLFCTQTFTQQMNVCRYDLGWDMLHAKVSSRNRICILMLINTPVKQRVLYSVYAWLLSRQLSRDKRQQVAPGLFFMPSQQEWLSDQAPSSTHPNLRKLLSFHSWMSKEIKWGNIYNFICLEWMFSHTLATNHLTTLHGSPWHYPWN